jgi:hypothetical protein
MSLLLLLACQAPQDADRDGTFVGNPGLIAKYVGTETEIPGGGVLVSQEFFVRPCDASEGDVALGAPQFDFEGAQSLNTEQIPAGHYCEVFLVVQQLSITFDAGEGPITIIGGDLDLVINTDLQAEDGGHYAIELGDSTWLAEMALEAEPGENWVNQDAALETLWLAGLLERSSVQELPR